jgi:hypothetical protein
MRLLIDGHLPYPYDREMIDDTIAKATAAVP